MTNISQNFADLINDGNIIDVEFIDQFSPVAGLLGLFYSEAAVAQLRDLAEDNEEWHFAVFETRRHLLNWQFQKVVFGTEHVASVLQVPGFECEDEPPTDAEKLLVKAFNKIPELIVDGKLKRNVVVLGATCTSKLDQEFKHLLVELHHGKSDDFEEVDLKLQTATQIIFEEGSLDNHSHKLQRQILGSLPTTPKSSGKFQILYRIHESEYLGAVLQKANDSFWSNPQAAIEDASKSIGAERNMFVTLVESKDLTSIFDMITEKFKEFLDSSNRFSNAIKRELNTKGVNSETGERWKYGVNIVYQIRCSIVHSGSGVIFENHDDGDDLLNSLIPLLESSVLKLMNVVSSD